MKDEESRAARDSMAGISSSSHLYAIATSRVSRIKVSPTLAMFRSPRFMILSSYHLIILEN